jgi:hypothetical protein
MDLATGTEPEAALATLPGGRPGNPAAAVAGGAKPALKGGDLALGPHRRAGRDQRLRNEERCQFTIRTECVDRRMRDRLHSGPIATWTGPS